MHVLSVTPSYSPFIGGAQAFQRAMAQRLVAAGHHITVLTTNARQADDFWMPPDGTADPLPNREIMNGVSVERVPLVYLWPSPYMFGLLRRAGHWLHRSGLPFRIQRPLLHWLARWMPPLPKLESALDRLAPQADLVQAVDSSWDGLFTAAASAAKRYGKPFVAVPLMHLSDASVMAHFQMVHQVDAYRNATVILALSQQEADAFAGLGVSSLHIAVIHMGVEPTPPDSHQPLEGMEFRYQNDPTVPIVAFLGANTYDKGAFTLARAVAHLNLSGLSVELVYAGPQRDELDAFLQQQPMDVRDILRQRVRVLGLVNEQTKQNLLAACDLLALPSRVDTFGIVLLEAWLHGKPVIGAQSGGISDLVQPEETGLLVPFEDVTALAAAIRRLLTEPKLAARLGNAGRRKVLKHYTWDQTYQMLLKIYTAALESSG
jgi:glycosyltransferase involved in cell wall biosynthesis